ncbi:MAG TPA: hypothetical protein VMA72_17040 [Streptosporangiaceae bacterium]|nr:hypothetical protein [Streptosporangiaceae bacterium]
MGEDALTGEPVMDLRAGERVCERLVANHVRDRRPYDGHLYVTTDRLVWLPWPFAQRQGAVSFDIPLAEVLQADVAERGSTWRERWHDRSLRERLRITRLSGEVEPFVVWHPHKAAELVDQARQGIA